MRTFIQKSKVTRQTASAKSTILSELPFGQSRTVGLVSHLENTIGNQAVLRILQTNAEEREVGLDPAESAHRHLMPDELNDTIEQAQLPSMHSSEDHPAVNRITHRVRPRDIPIETGSMPASQIALTPNKPPGGTAPKTSIFSGLRLGRNSYGEDVVVKRELGSTKGYDERLQAIAVARLSNATLTAVFQDDNGKWHSVENTAFITENRFYAYEGSPLHLEGLPAVGAIRYWNERVVSLREELAILDAKKALSAIEQEKKADVSRELAQATRTRASVILGVPESEIELNVYSSGRVPGKVNFTGQPGAGSTTSGRHGPVSGQDFTPTMLTAFDINYSLLDDPAKAQKTMFHEAQHLHDYQFAQQWVKNYEMETGRSFISPKSGPKVAALWQKVFGDWLKIQVSKKRLSRGDAELVVDETFDFTATTEARANVRTFLAILQAGNSDLATKTLVNYVRELKPGGAYATPANGSHVLAELITELKAAYRQMPKDMKKQFNAAVDTAMKEYPSAWISALRFSN